MQLRIATWLTAIGMASAAATPALAHSHWYTPAPSFYYQSPDGSYPSYSDFIRDLRGTPCGVECTRRAEIRWGLIPAPNGHHYNYDYYDAH